MWSVTNYEGQYAFGTSGVLTNAMFELCRAVNERQLAIDVPLTEFKDKDGNLGTFLSLEAIVGMFTTGEDNYFRYNCTQIMGWIRSAVSAGWFMEEPSASSSQWTSASMMADIGLGTSWLDALSQTYPDNVCDYVFYQRCQEALDRMKYVVARNRYDDTTPMAITGSNSDAYVQLADAWANRGDFPYASPITGADPSLVISLDRYFSDAIAATATQIQVPFDKGKYFPGSSITGLGSSTLDGVMIESYAGVNRIRTSNGPPGYSVSFGSLAVDGENAPWPITTLPQSPLDVSVFSPTRLLQIYDSPSLTDDFVVPVLLSEPSSFSSGAVFGDYAILQFIEVYVDISSELSDQT